MTKYTPELGKPLYTQIYQQPNYGMSPDLWMKIQITVQHPVNDEMYQLRREVKRQIQVDI